MEVTERRELPPNAVNRHAVVVDVTPRGQVMKEGFHILDRCPAVIQQTGTRSPGRRVEH